MYGYNGDIGIGVLAPSNKFEIKSNATSPSPSGLRFTNLNNTSASTTNPTNKILSVNATGDVVLVDDKTGVVTATTNQLTVVGSTLTSTVNGVSSSAPLTNIYNNDGTLKSDRSVYLKDKYLSFNDNSGNKLIEVGI